MAHLKRNVVEVKAEDNCLAHALIIAIAKVDNNPNCTSYRDGIKIRPVVQKQLANTGKTCPDVRIPQLKKSNNIFGSTRQLSIKSWYVKTMFEGQVDSANGINLL